MKILTNVYHVRADNGLQYEDFTSYSATVHARNEDEALRKGLAQIAKECGWDDTDGLHNGEAKLVFEKANLEVPTPEPFTMNVGEVDFHYDFSRMTLQVAVGSQGFEFDNSDLQKISVYLGELTEKLKAMGE